ncbi:ribosomal protein S18-alanine N-acetyltransferase [Crossiella sp. CA198]|uniref:ribosomal protein S18-alanine N-acetyltransferase n=1 Tax=Crossiella sp. CA198 TaxID=3455607 RepID=UPI003F8D1E61
MTVHIGPLRKRDLKRCAEMEAELFAGDDPWSAAAFAAELDGGHHYVGAYAGDELIGYAGIALLVGPPQAEAEVHTIAVHPDWQGNGIGKALLLDLLAHVAQVGATVFLEVRTDNEPAIALYERQGFEKLGVRRRYYQPSGADAFTMRRLAPAETAGRTA